MSRHELQPVSVLPSEYMLQELKAMYENHDMSDIVWVQRRAAVMSGRLNENADKLREALLADSVVIEGDRIEVKRVLNGGMFTTKIDIGDRTVTDSVALGTFSGKRWEVCFDKESTVPDPSYQGFYPNFYGSEQGTFSRLEVLPKGRGLRDTN